jgi:hypothetical protein
LIWSSAALTHADATWTPRACRLIGAHTRAFAANRRWLVFWCPTSQGCGHEKPASTSRRSTEPMPETAPPCYPTSPHRPHDKAKLEGRCSLRFASGWPRTASSPGARTCGAFPQVDGEYTAGTEDVLDLYAEAPDPERPVICFDESPGSSARFVSPSGPSRVNSNAAITSAAATPSLRRPRSASRLEQGRVTERRIH